ncbi:hypothetical protein RvY_17096-2 [Ramazzottius varieornatus]|uniref:Uncharacterized protein n=1 Tax=Ramazzottius varieornatus TaxID=947166 RepID=A0A1D1W0Y2_RAMVA|nr:hypothetical protein RvY_17096-2 [Ramazzottius varieornatus]
METTRKEESKLYCGTTDSGSCMATAFLVPSSLKIEEAEDCVLSDRRSTASGKQKNVSAMQLAASYFPCTSSMATVPTRRTEQGRGQNVERGSRSGQESPTAQLTQGLAEKLVSNADRCFQRRAHDGDGIWKDGSNALLGRSAAVPERPFLDPAVMNSPFGYLPEAVRQQWMQMFAAINNQPTTAPHQTHASSSTDEFEHSFKFQNHLAKAADERSKRHVKNLHKCVRNLVQMMGALEATYTTIRGCFYGSLCALEYGSHCWNLLRGFSVVRLLFSVLRTFWRYVKVFGQRAPLVGLLALLCTYVGRTCLPLIQKLLLQGSREPPCLPADVRRVQVNYTATKPDELSVSAGEDLVIGRK